QRRSESVRLQRCYDGSPGAIVRLLSPRRGQLEDPAAGVQVLRDRLNGMDTWARRTGARIHGAGQHGRPGEVAEGGPRHTGSYRLKSAVYYEDACTNGARACRPFGPAAD